MAPNELFIKVLSEGYLMKLEFMRSILAVPVKSNSVEATDDGYDVTLDDVIISVKCDNTKPLFSISDKITLPVGCMSIVKSDIDTTYGRAIANYLLLEVGLKGLIPYKNEMFTFADIEKDVLIPGINSGEIELSIYKKCIDVDVFMRSLSDIVVVAVSEKMVFAPDDLKAFKKKTIKEYVEKYGKDWKSDKKIVIQYEEVIMRYYKEYLKDDPAYDITLDKKMLKSMQSRNVAIGILDSLDPNANNEAIISSLYDGVPEDLDELTSVFNSIIFGSAARGSLTAVGGVISKTLTRATHNYKVSEDDCGVNYGMKMSVRETSVGRVLVNGTVLTKKNIGTYLDKEVEMRSVVYCKSKGENFCRKCAGADLSQLEGSILLIALGIGGGVLSHYLAMFHSVSRKVIPLKKEEMF